MGDGASMDAALSDAAAELYAGPLDEFTKRRTALANAAEKLVAARIRKLPKPVVAAWVINMLARRDPDRLGELAELGERIAEAQDELDADRLRATGRERARLVPAITRDAVALAEELERSVGEGIAREVEQTLEAAAVNRAVADAVRGGLLVKAPLTADADDGDIAAAVALSADATPQPKAVKGRASKRDDLARKRRETAENAVAEAESEAASAEADDAELTARLDKARGERHELEAQRDDLERQLQELARRLDALDDDIDTLEGHRDDTHERVQQSRRELRAARQALRKLR
ncbi:hypothetical protein SAMN04489806_1760 [Paramicrobacterium humi]|uniref:Uncharacterized protein n=1 Tax=Paramicrobacterium humi TaxID=640635 RepID=A0A1H4M6J5_9MICO|nr:hypothetical protein [Microbacterium humi]SEB78115.1 hypothetical protein SAMN04489806_1760 [Microbacterium humi]